MSGQYLSMAITLSNKTDFSYRDNMVGFHKSSHICDRIIKFTVEINSRDLNMWQLCLNDFGHIGKH